VGWRGLEGTGGDWRARKVEWQRAGTLMATATFAPRRFFLDEDTGKLSQHEIHINGGSLLRVSASDSDDPR